MMKTGKSPKAAVAIGSRITLEVRYKGSFNVKWYLNGKEILNSSKSKHFELISIGNTHGLKALKIRNFKKEIAGEYKIRLNTTGCVYMKSIQVEVESEYHRPRSLFTLYSVFAIFEKFICSCILLVLHHKQC